MSKNDCGIVAVLEAWRLFKAKGVASRILMLASPDIEEAHCALVYETPSGGVMVYDSDGTRDLEISPQASALKIARAAFGSTVSAAYFYEGLARTLEGISKNRRLSPREARSCLPAFDLLKRAHEEHPPEVQSRRLPPLRFGRGLFTI